MPKNYDMLPVLVQFQVDSGQRVHWLERATGGGCRFFLFGIMSALERFQSLAWKLAHFGL